MKDKAGIERPWLYRAIRVSEVVGVLTVLYGLAASEWLIAIGGVGVILVSYRVFHRCFDVITGPDDGSMGMSGGD